MLCIVHIVGPKLEGASKPAYGCQVIVQVTTFMVNSANNSWLILQTIHGYFCN